MATRTIINDNYLTADGKSMSTGFRGDNIDMRDVSQIAIQASWTSAGAPQGSIDIQITVDGETWETMGQAHDVSNGNGVIFQVSGVLARYIRLRYSFVGGGSGDIMKAAFIAKSNRG